MEEIKTTEEIIIQKISMDVQREFQMDELADCLHFNFASEVAKRYANLAVSKEREKVLKEIRKQLK